MKRMSRLIRAVSLTLAIVSTAIEGAPPQPQMEFSRGTSNSYNAEWTGLAERTYFVQWSLDLEDWTIAPFMAHGVAPLGVHTHGGESDAPAFFLRLKFADIPTADPELADFDNDGLSNLAEVDLWIDPLNPDTDGDGVTDGVEVANSGNPLSNVDGDPFHSGDSDGDGLSDAVEAKMGTSPTLWDSDGDGVVDANDAFPLDPERHAFPVSDPSDLTGPLVTLEAPSNAVFVSGP
jgi:Bacterial TSP3 repeat